jgi:hypothetical protein
MRYTGGAIGKDFGKVHLPAWAARDESMKKRFFR